MKKRFFLSIVMVLCMAITILPTMASAVEDGVNTEEELIAAVQTDGEITLTGDIELTKVLEIPSGATVTIDLAGHSITQTGTRMVDWCVTEDIPWDESYCLGAGCEKSQRETGLNAIYLIGSSSLTINDSVGDGSITGTYNGISNDGGAEATLVVNGGTISSTLYNAIWNWESTVTINGGTFYGGVYHATSIKDGTFYGEVYVGASDNYTGTVENGTFHADVYAGTVQNGAFNDSVYVTVAISGGTFNGGVTSRNNAVTITGGTFGNLMVRSSNSLSNCTINGVLNWSGTAVPAIDNVEFGESASVGKFGYELINGQISEKEKYSIIVAAASENGSVSITHYNINGIAGTISAGQDWVRNDIYEGSSATFRATATPKDNYTFVGWYDNEKGAGQPISVANPVEYETDENGLMGDCTYYAVFETTDSYEEQLAIVEAWVGDYDNTEIFNINNKNDLAALALAVNNLGKTFEGKTISLNANLTYTEGEAFTPIGVDGAPFQGTFDGNEYTIRGLSYTAANSNSGYVGLFGYVSNATIQDLTLDGVMFSNGYMTGAFAGHADKSTFHNCHLTGATLSDAYFLGGILGHSNGGNKVENCSVKNSSIDDSWKTGSVAGYVCGIDVDGFTVNNTTIGHNDFSAALIGHANAGNTNLTNIVVTEVKDRNGEKTGLIGTNYSGGENYTITIDGENTHADVSALINSTNTVTFSVKNGDFTCEIPEAYLPEPVGSETEKVSVTFKNGEDIVIVKIIEKNNTISDMPVITRVDDTLLGWYTAEGVRATEETSFDKSITLSAKWESEQVTPPVVNNPTYTITNPTVTGGTVTVSPRSASRGRLVTLTVTPDEGYELASLTVTDSRGNTVTLTDAGNGKYTFTMPGSRVVVNAAFQLASLPFTDVAEGAWYYDAIAYVYRNGLMAGVSSTQFAPDSTLNRATLATILWRLAGEPVVNYVLPFEDVAEGEWYSEAIRWAASTGIVNGTTPTTFRPFNSVTREQMAAMVHRYAEYMGYDTTASTDLGAFTDAASVNSYAAEPMGWCVAEGLISGIGTEIRPQSSATRAQIATMLMRFCENIAK